MTPIEIITAEIVFWTIAILSIKIAVVFYRTKNGRLRLLMIDLFISKAIVYGGIGILMFLQYSDIISWSLSVFIRILVTLPMFFVMLKLYRFVKNKPSL